MADRWNIQDCPEEWRRDGIFNDPRKKMLTQKGIMLKGRGLGPE
jgi:hypothetical protein